MINLCLMFLISSLGHEPVRAGYAPRLCDCPTTPLVRPGGNLSDGEEAYRVARKLQADEALRNWLNKTDAGFGVEELPTVSTRILCEIKPILTLGRLHLLLVVVATDHYSQAQA